MIKGTTFGSIHSGADLHLLQQKVVVQPASPKTKYIDIPGADGSKDMTEALGVGVKYSDRGITWTFALYPGDDWSEKCREVSGALNGISCRIVLDEDSLYYYEGRLEVENYERDKLLRRIIVYALCRPYKLKRTVTTVSSQSLGTADKTLLLENDRMTVVPVITVEQETTITFNNYSATVAAGAHKLPDIQLQMGRNILKARVSTGTGSIKVSYQEGTL